MLKYLIAAIAAGFLILAMFGFIWKTEGEFRQYALDRGWDGEQDVGMELPGDLLQRRRRPVVVDHHPVQQAWVGPTSPYQAKFPGSVLHRLVHLELGLFKQFLDHGATSVH